MAEIIEKTGKSYNIFDKINNVWNKCSFWTHSNDVFYPDGKSATTKHGAINGITSDITGEAEDIAASIKCVNQLNSSLENKIVHQVYSIPCTQGNNPYYGDILVEKDGYTAFSATIETPIMGIDHMQSCGFRKNDKTVYGQSDIPGTMGVKVAYIKN